MRRLPLTLAALAFAISGSAFACEYGMKDDSFAAAPVEASKKPLVLASCEKGNCDGKLDHAAAPSSDPKKAAAASKSAKKSIVLACEGPNCKPAPTSR